MFDQSIDRVDAVIKVKNCFITWKERKLRFGNAYNIAV